MRNLVEKFFVGGYISSPIENYIKQNTKIIDKEIYRGLQYPLHLLNTGSIIEEWSGSTHWSYSEDIAIDFTGTEIDEDYVQELIDSGVKDLEFVPLVMFARGLEGCDMAPLLKEYGMDESFGYEREVAIIGKDFRIISIFIESDINGYVLYYAHVVPV